ncbi:MAG: pre-peptidase C-terminal domain-containing protein [Chloroflexota bacterium]
MSRILNNSSNTKITIDAQEISSGGEGIVYKIVSPRSLADYCVKLYNKPQLHRREDKIKFMVANPPQKLRDSSYMVCWPTDLLYKNGSFVGYMMPLAFTGSVELNEFTTLNFRANMPKSWTRKFDRGQGEGILTRLKLCVNVAIAVHMIHSFVRYVLVDLKPQNILVSQDGKISMIDLDSIQITEGDNVLFPGPVATPDYTPPEGFTSNIAIKKSWDEFSLAVVFYQVLFGLHPYAATTKGRYKDSTTIDEKISSGLFVHGSKSSFIDVKPKPHDNFYRLSQPVQSLFLTAFDMNPNGRPSAETWGKTMYQDVQKAQVYISQAGPATNPYIQVLQNKGGPAIQTLVNTIAARKSASKTPKTTKWIPRFVMGVILGLLLILALIHIGLEIDDTADEYWNATRLYRFDSDLIYPIRDQDWYYFNLSDAQYVTIQTEAPEDTAINLYQGRSDWPRVGYDDSRRAWVSRISTCLGEGEYTVLVTSHDYSFKLPYSYNIRFDTANLDRCNNASNIASPENPYNGSLDNENPWDNATKLWSNQPHGDSIDPATQEDWFVFEVTQNQESVQIYMTGNLGNTVLKLYRSPFSNPIASDDDIEGNGYSVIQYTCDAPLSWGTYYIRAHSFDYSSVIPFYEIGVSMRPCQ